MSKRNTNNYVTHDFYCINCGKKGIPLPRQASHSHCSLHRKIMYCPHCGHTINHIECATAQDVQKFYDAFKAGKFIQEAQEELKYELEHPKFQILLKGK